MKNQLVMFLVGLAMLTLGLFWLTSMVQVTIGWGAGLRIGGATIPSGITLVPLIAGILWVFFNPKSAGAKVLLIIGVLVLIGSILMTIRFQMPRTSLFEFILVFIGIAGGAGLVSRVLFVKCTKSEDGK